MSVISLITLPSSALNTALTSSTFEATISISMMVVGFVALTVMITGVVSSSGMSSNGPLPGWSPFDSGCVVTVVPSASRRLIMEQVVITVVPTAMEPVVEGTFVEVKSSILPMSSSSLSSTVEIIR